MPALDGMRILDMTQYEAGTSCTQTLAQLGAEVVKVEPPRGDAGRGLLHGDTRSQYFYNYNCNKRSVVLNLQHPRGRELLLDMAPHFNAFVENYGPGVVEALDIGYEVLMQRNPTIIYARIKGFGLSGPYSKYKVYDSVATAASGAYSLSGMPGGPPVHPGITYSDSGTGLQMAIALLAAYVQQQRTGEGQLIELSMQEATTMFIRTAALRGWGREPAPRRGNRTRPPTDIYPCKPFGANDYVHLIIVTQRMWDTFCAVIGRPDMADDPRYATVEARVEHGDEVHDIVEAWTRQRTKHEAMHELASAGVPCSAILDTYELWSDPHLRERDFIQTIDHPEGAIDVMRLPMRLSASEVPIERPPLLGEHTDEVLREELSLTPGELAELRAQGVIC
jgi:formyl-CoA transferase